MQTNEGVGVLAALSVVKEPLYLYYKRLGKEKKVPAFAGNQI
jgi:hypothetical protein